MIGRIASTVARTVDDSVLKVVSNTGAAVHAVHMVNTTSSLRRVRLHHCIGGETSSTANALLYDAPIAPNGTLVHDSRFAMMAGDDLRAKCDGSGVTIVVHGMAAG
jgi:hypothetical protein